LWEPSDEPGIRGERRDCRKHGKPGSVSLSDARLAATFESAFSDVTRSYAGKGVARYQW
jgi:hypothetical protein